MSLRRAAWVKSIRGDVAIVAIHIELALVTRLPRCAAMTFFIIYPINKKSDEPKPIAFQNPKSKIRYPKLYQQPYRLF
ncbi:hypothetical protein SAMN05192573_105182 [Mucilaginibacter gossypii]|uniref:Uncharacterized protein n=1 Tax=Mucilaginibacter gossypii TaxID=551996 RepID=A0A1G7XVE5_9SPHI|nr:hypothetical protein SAMN05192573_105182 [Mucilaginibacter gossypii]